MENMVSEACVGKRGTRKGPLDMMSSVGLYEMWLIRSNFIKTTYDISLDSQISFLPLGFSPTIYLLFLLQLEQDQETDDRE